MVALCLQPNYSHIHSLYAIVQWKIIFQKSKIPQIHILMSFNSIRGLVTLELIIHKIICGVTGDGCLVFPAKIFLYLLSICYCWMENHFPKVKKTSNWFLLKSFNSIRIMIGYTFLKTTINIWSDCWWLLVVSSPTIVIFTFNMLLVDVK